MNGVEFRLVPRFVYLKLLKRYICLFCEKVA